MKVEIWSDVVCPWCYIGKRRFEKALAEFAHRDDVEIEWKAFELDPSAVSGARHEGDYAGRLARKYGMDVEQARQMLDSMTATAAAEGLDFHFERAVRANTVDAHQVIHLAGLRGVQDAVKERLLRGYFTEGEAVADRETLVRLAAEAGLDASEVRSALEGQSYLPNVREDQREAQAFGISGVPFFVIDRKYGVSGAQPPAALLEVLEQAWAESHPVPTLLTVGGDASNGDACGPDGCPV
ncbi:MAG TPA: DsbA family oxidoreductase [Frankiaceae bacterium]|nr:DsbA family oxidoreductase [Frankiaceae bacterium]